MHSIHAVIEGGRLVDAYASNATHARVGAGIDAGDADAVKAVAMLEQALLSYDPVNDRNATTLSPRWWRLGTVLPGGFAFGISHLNEARDWIMFSSTEGRLASASDGTHRVLQALRILRPYLRHTAS